MTSRQMQDQEYRDRLAEQLDRERREAHGDEVLMRERRREFRWDFEGWTADDRLIVHITGMGTLHIPLRDVEQLANAMLAEHEILTSGPQSDPREEE